MTLRSIKFVVSGFAAVFTLASTAPAQFFAGQRSIVNVPFAFEVGPEHFQPGVYTLDLQSQSTLRVQGESKSGLLMVIAEAGRRTQAENKVVFEHIGDKYFLLEVWNSNNSMHLQAYRTREEKQARINLAALAAPQNQPTTTTLATY